MVAPTNRKDFCANSVLIIVCAQKYFTITNIMNILLLQIIQHYDNSLRAQKYGCIDTLNPDPDPHPNPDPDLDPNPDLDPVCSYLSV